MKPTTIWLLIAAAAAWYVYRSLFSGWSTARKPQAPSGPIQEKDWNRLGISPSAKPLPPAKDAAAQSAPPPARTFLPTAESKAQAAAGGIVATKTDAPPFVDWLNKQKAIAGYL